jgi:hypothetical protein
VQRFPVPQPTLSSFQLSGEARDCESCFAGVCFPFGNVSERGVESVTPLESDKIHTSDEPFATYAYHRPVRPSLQSLLAP